MAIYKDGKHNEGVITKVVRNQQYYIDRAKKAKQNKEKLIEEIVDNMMNDIYNYKDVIRDLLTEVFQKTSQKDLKTWL